MRAAWRTTAGSIARLRAADVRCAVSLEDKDAHHRTILLSGYSTMPCARAAFSRGISSRTVRSSMIVFTATQSSSLSGDTVGRCSAGSSVEHARQIRAFDVQHQAHAAVRFNRRPQQQCQVLDLLPLRRIGQRCAIRDELRVGAHHGVDDAQPVGLAATIRSP